MRNTAAIADDLGRLIELNAPLCFKRGILATLACDRLPEHIFLKEGAPPAVELLLDALFVLLFHKIDTVADSLLPLRPRLVELNEEVEICFAPEPIRQFLEHSQSSIGLATQEGDHIGPHEEKVKHLGAVPADRLFLL